MEERKPIIAPALSNAGVVNLEKGKIPPQAVDLEEAVLGAMLIDKKVSTKSSIFYKSTLFTKKHINTFLKRFTSCLRAQSPSTCSPFQPN